MTGSGGRSSVILFRVPRWQTYHRCTSTTCVVWLMSRLVGLLLTLPGVKDWEVFPCNP